MKRYLRILALGLLLWGMASCADDNFETDTSSNISEEALKEAIFKNGALAEGLVSGIYSATLTVEVEDGRRHDDAFGQKAIDLSSDIISGDMCIAANAYGWFYDDEELKSSTVSSGRTEVMWTLYYKLIRGANDVLAAYESETIAPKAGADVWAQAKAMRAYAYYNLAYLFSAGYNVGGDNSAPCVVIYTSKDQVAGSLSTSQEVWDFIKADLEQASPILTTNPAVKSSIGGSVAKGLLAYTYLTMGEYSKAITCADDALSIGGYTIATANQITGGFNDVANNPSWMWGTNITKENTTGLGTFWGMFDIYTYGYGATPMSKTIDDNLYAQIKDNDARKYQFQFFGKNKNRVAGWKFYHSDRIVDGDRVFESDVHFMRAAEMLLIKAEAKARLGQDASPEINQLLAARKAEDIKHEKFMIPTNDANSETAVPDGYVVPAYAQGTPVYGSTLDDIYLQWRIEMWGEGQGLIILKRFKKTMTRGNNHAELKGAKIPYNDERLIFPIPNSETNDNPNID